MNKYDYSWNVTMIESKGLIIGEWPQSYVYTKARDSANLDIESGNQNDWLFSLSRIGS